MIEIVTFAQLVGYKNSIEVHAEIENIFFLSSNTTSFDSDEKRNLFFKIWCGQYVERCPEVFYLAFDFKKRLLGYLSGHLDSNQAMIQFQIPALDIFADLFGQYPAHLHINCHPESRGMGIGGTLIERFCRDLHAKNIPGVHIVTGPNARNVEFYRKNGFAHEEVRDYKGNSLLFMGKELLPIA